MLKIDKKITGFKVINKEELELKFKKEAEEAEFLEKEKKRSEKLHREEILTGKTYKIKPSSLNHGLYITINDLLLEGQKVPYEVFINTKNAEEDHFLKVLSLTLTTLFRLRQDISHLLAEYADIPAVNGGYWARPKAEDEKGVFYKSYIGQIADVIKKHLQNLKKENESRELLAEIEIINTASGIQAEAEASLASFIEAGEKIVREAVGVKSSLLQGEEFGTSLSPRNSVYPEVIELIEALDKKDEEKPTGQVCPSCGEASMQLLDGCLTCLTCGFSKCG